MDDSASALDFKTDAALRRAIRMLSGADSSVTTVVVSQRVSSVRGADLICVMCHGRAVGVGTHEELMATCEVYREIAESQLYSDAAASAAEEGGAHA